MAVCSVSRAGTEGRALVLSLMRFLCLKGCVFLVQTCISIAPFRSARYFAESRLRYP